MMILPPTRYRQRIRMVLLPSTANHTLWRIIRVGLKLASISKECKILMVTI